MNESMYQYMKVGLISFKAYPTTIKGEGPVVEVIKKIVADDYFNPIELPYRAFLPKKINNLLLAGECLSCTHEWFYGYRLIRWSMRTGELAGTAASMAVKQGITAKDIKWTFGYFDDSMN